MLFIIFPVIFVLEPHSLLAKSLKSVNSCFLNAVSFVIGVGTNFNPRERRLNSKFERFFCIFS